MNPVDLNAILKAPNILEEHVLHQDTSRTNLSRLKLIQDLLCKRVDCRLFIDTDGCQNIYHCAIEMETIDANSFMRPGENIVFFVQPRYFYFKEHRHSFLELVYVYEGSCLQIINGKEVMLKKGDACLMDTTVRHSVASLGEDDIVINCLLRKDYFDPGVLSFFEGNDILNDFFTGAIYQTRSLNNYFIFPYDENSKVHRFVTDILCEYFDPQISSGKAVECYLILLFTELIRSYKGRIEKTGCLESKKITIIDMLRYLEANYKDASLQAMAQYFNFHPNYLSVYIKKLTGKKFMDLLQEIRLKKACSLIKYSDIPINDIAYEVGYRNMSYYYTIFKKHYGITPAEYRRNPQVLL